MIELLEADYRAYHETLRAAAREFSRDPLPRGDAVSVAKSSDADDDEEWDRARFKWSPLLKALGGAYSHLDKWAEIIARRAAMDPRVDVVKAATSFEPRQWAMVRPMLLGYARSSVPQVLKSAAAEYHRITKKTLPDPAEEMALAAVSDAGAELVQGISRRSQQAIQEAVMRGIAQGRSIDKIAADIKQTIGLTPRDAAAVMSYAARLEAEDRKQSQRDRMVARLRQRKIRQRAVTIARTEMNRARNIGFDMAWQLGVIEGEIDPEDRREWIAKDPCPVCTEMNGVKATLGTPFTSPGGQVFMRPPAHPNCKCGMVLDV